MKNRSLTGLIALLTALALAQTAFASGIQAQEQQPAPTQERPQEPATDMAVLKSLDYGKTDKTLDVFIGLEGVFIYQVFELGDPLRLAVDISPANRILAGPLHEVNEWTLAGIRIGQFHPYIVRVVFDFSGSILPYEVTRLENGLKSTFKPEGERVIALPPPVPEPVREVTPVAVTPAVTKPIRPERLKTMIGLSAGSYKVSDELFQEVYPGSSLIYGLQLSQILVSSGDLDIGLSAEVRKTSKVGAATVTLEDSTFAMTPVSIGATLFWNSKAVILFAGAGLDFYSYKETSPLYVDTGFISDSASGSHFQVGAILRLPSLEALRAKVYYKGTSVVTTNNDIEANLGGSEFGFSLNFAFDLF